MNQTSFKTSLCLTKLQGATVETAANGKKFVAIPVEDNDIFVSEKGHAYLSLVHWCNSKGPDQKGNTHSVKISPSLQFMQAHQGFQSPFVGDSKPIIPRSQQQAPAQMPYQQYPQQQMSQQFQQPQQGYPQYPQQKPPF